VVVKTQFVLAAGSCEHLKLYSESHSNGLSFLLARLGGCWCAGGGISEYRLADFKMFRSSSALWNYRGTVGHTPCPLPVLSWMQGHA